MSPVAENAQHEPHCPWFFTGVTAPFSRQSIEVGVSVMSRGLACVALVFVRTALKPSLVDRNSSSVKSAKGVAPYCAPSFKLFSHSTFFMFTSKMPRRISYSSAEYERPCSRTNQSKSTIVEPTIRADTGTGGRARDSESVASITQISNAPGRIRKAIS